MALTVPGVPAEPPRPLPGENDRLRPPPPAGEKPPPTEFDLDHLHHSATTAAQSTSAIKKHTRNICTRPFLFDWLLLKNRCPGSRGLNPASDGGIPGGSTIPAGQDHRAYRRSKTAQAPEHLPTGWKARTAAGSPPSAKGHWRKRQDSNLRRPSRAERISNPPQYQLCLLFHVGDGICAVPYLA